MKEEDKIADLFAKELADLSFTPDVSVKINIDRAIQAKKKKRLLIWWIFPIGLATLIIVIILGIQLSKPIETNNFGLAKSSEKEQKEEIKDEIAIKKAVKQTINSKKEDDEQLNGLNSIINSIKIDDKKQEINHHSDSQNKTNSLTEIEPLYNNIDNINVDQKVDSINEELLVDQLRIRKVDSFQNESPRLNAITFNNNQSVNPTKYGWLLGASHMYEFEQRKPFYELDSAQLLDYNYLQYRVSATHLTHKIEAWKPLSKQISVLLGLGFRQTNYVTTKNTYFYYITGVPDLSASVPEETIKLINYKTDRRGEENMNL